MPPSAGRDRFFKQTRDDGGHAHMRQATKPRVQRAARSSDPFFVTSGKHAADGESEERREDEEADELSAASASHSSHSRRGNKRHRAYRDDQQQPADDTDAQPSSHAHSTKHSATQPAKRRKDAPLEMSSKHPTPLPPLSAVQLLQPKSLQPRDPRFDSLLPQTSFSSHFNAKGAYAFLDELKEAEVADMSRLAKRLKSQQKREEAKAELQSILSAKKEHERKDREQGALRSWKKQEMAARREGKRPFHLKERDKKAVKLVSEYARLKGKGQEGAIVRKVEKKRRQRAQQDKRSMPRQAHGGGQ